MLFTENYKLGSVVVDETLNPLEDSRRFLVIDRQLLGLFQLFGNGVIDGWNLTSAGTLSLSISSGRGHINYLSCVTADARVVSGLLPNLTSYIYAEITSTTRFTRDIRFVATTSIRPISNEYVLLGSVVTSDTGVTSVDESSRNNISFLDQIIQEIASHVHRGGSTNPSKIDLSSEVFGRLSGSRIADLDASKLTSGIISPSRLPLINHSDLEGSGVLTHAQIDSYIKNLSTPGISSLMELSTTNLLQLYLAQKHIWNDIDEYSPNMMAVIPGITPDTYLDEVNSTAIIDKVNHLIQGIPSVSGELISTTYSTQSDFNNAVLSSNINVTTDETSDYFKLTKPLSESIVESFDGVFTNGTDLSDIGWVAETVASDDNTSFESDGTKKVDGAFSAKWNVNQSVRIQVTKQFTTTADWSAYNALETYIQCTSATHGRVMMQLLKLNATTSVLEEIDSFILIDTNDITTGFRQVTRDLTSVTRTAVDAIRIYCDSAMGWDLTNFIVNIDQIKLSNNLYYSQTGRLRFRLKTPQQSQWASIAWTGDTNGGQILARARTAPSYETFDQSDISVFSSYISSPGDPDVDDNNCIEVEIALSASGDRTASPIVRTVTIGYITSSTETGLTIDTTEEFLRASLLENCEVTSNTVQIEGRIDVDDWVYGLKNSVQQVPPSEDNTGSTTVGITGNYLPMAPIQAATPANSRTLGLSGCTHVERLYDRTYLVCDTNNDRIVLFDKNGTALRILASNAMKGKEIYPLSASYNRDERNLYICWSGNVNTSTIDISKIRISGAGLSITLSSTSDTVSRITGLGSQNNADNVTIINLSSAHYALLEDYLGNTNASTINIYLNIEATAVSEGINSDSTNYASLLSPKGLPIYVGNVTYIKGIYSPVSCIRTSTGTWLICNAKPLVTGSDGTNILTGLSTTEITSIIEIDSTTGEILFSDNSVDFSVLTLGSAVDIDNQYVVMAGLENKSDTTINSSTTLTEVQALANKVGIIKRIEKSSGRQDFEQNTTDGMYASDIQVDADGNYVIVEKSFSTASKINGRVVKMDAENGNIFYQFGLAELASPNDVRVLSTGNLVISS